MDRVLSSSASGTLVEARAGTLDARRRLVPTSIVGAWLIAAVAQLTGNAGLLHHHALIENGPPPWIAVPAILVAWQVMVVAMMLPASLPAISAFESAAARLRRPGLALATFLGAYSLVWIAVGLALFAGDAILHRVVDASPWLAAREWIIESAVLALAGAYQFTGFKRRRLMACREPHRAAGLGPRPSSGAWQQGLEHGLDCVGASWALMLVMFAAGFANLWWMAGLTAVMAYEAIGRHGRRVVPIVGVAFVALAALTVAFGLQVV
jgi:predicted metal-binding membrane protein